MQTQLENGLYRLLTYERFNSINDSPNQIRHALGCVKFGMAVDQEHVARWVAPVPAGGVGRKHDHVIGEENCARGEQDASRSHAVQPAISHGIANGVEHV